MANEVQQLRDDARIGQEVEALLKHPLLEQILAAAESKAVELWKRSKPEETVVREQAYAMRSALELILDEAHTLINRGQMAAAQLKRRRE
jgi:hypothetical protein